MADKFQRSLAKTISWRIVATTITMLLVYSVTKKITVSLGIGLIEVVVKMIAYYLHERSWNKVTWGRNGNKKTYEQDGAVQS